ncbi:MAG TPA: thioredoxin family protein [Burkholderiaceae bacterium]|nr:thioredoxin family protein [Burkholderiaceae bacterium]
MLLNRLLLCAALCGVMFVARAASSEAATPQVRSILVASVAGVHAGERIVVGVQQRIAEGWHTYGRDPGDAGLPTRIRWTVPDGAVAGAIQWPQPKRFQQGLVTSFGYEGDVTLRADVSVPPTMHAGEDFAVSADVSWIVCRDVCVPQRAALSLSLPVLATGEPAGPGSLVAGEASAADPPQSLAAALGLALLGGLVLNLMPCVFPVLSIKALSLLQQARHSPRKARLHGWAYTAGVLASFVLLGLALVALKLGGAHVGWGFQYQSPAFVLIIAWLMFAVGLSLSGLFVPGASAAGWGSALAARAGYGGSFFGGALAAVVATPCTAPFMGAAIGHALTQPAATLLAIFIALGVGLALPYLLLSHWPALQRHLPRPGRWMEHLKQGLAFPMYAAAVWLVWVLAQQGGPAAVAAALGGMLAIAFAAWVLRSTRSPRARVRRTGAAIAAAALATAWLSGPAVLQARDETPDATEVYSAQRLQELRAQGRPVFLYFTAAWCISCLVNERVALADRDVRQAFARAGIAVLKGDWTQQDRQITAKLDEFGRSGVPLYVYYPAGGEPVVLPQILTPGIVLGAVQASSQHALLRPQQ